MESRDDWDKNSRLVLQSLQGLESSVEKLNERIGQLEKQLIQEGTKERRIVSLEDWRLDCDSIVNKRQMVAMMKEVEELKIFKSRATFVFSVVQAGVFVVVLLLKFLKTKG